MVTRVPAGEEQKKFTEIVTAISEVITEQFRIYGNNIGTANITTVKSFRSKSVDINIRLNLKQVAT